MLIVPEMSTASRVTYLPAADEVQKLHTGVLGAYRWQYIVSGVQEPRFAKALGSLITPEQGAHIGKALATILP